MKPLILLCCLCSFLLFSCQKNDKTPPNIIFIMADDLGYGDLGCYGQEKIETPNIDALAKNGMRFTQFYAGSPVCAPSRCVLLTGKHTGHAYVRGNHEWGSRGEVWNFAKASVDPNLEGQYPMPDTTLTVAKLLQDNGYKTGMVGKWGLGGPLSNSIPTKQGFDFFYGYNCQRQAHTYYPVHLWKNEEKDVLGNRVVAPGTKLAEGADTNDVTSYANYKLTTYAPERMLEEAIGFIDNNKDDPFYLYYASPIPHLPLQAPERWVTYYQEKFGEERPYIGGKGYFPNQTPRATYAAMVSYLDEQVGELVNKLKKLDLYENTLIVFTSDNGATYDVGGADSPFFDSNKPFRNERGYGKGYVQEGGIRVPMIATWENEIKQGTTSEYIGAFWDVLPTLCDLTQTQLPDAIDGISFVNELKGEAQQSHEFLYWEFPSYKGQQAVRLGKWKAIRRNMFDGNLVVELYDLDNDIKEQYNVAAQHPEIVAQVESILKEQHTQSELKRFRFEVLGEEK